MSKKTKTSKRQNKKLDAVTLEVIRNALPAIANEMAADLQRTSYNMMIYEVRDFCTSLVNTKGELISQNVGGVSHFVADLGVIITDVMKRYGPKGFAEGDVIITQDLFVYEMLGEDANGKLLGRHRSTGIGRPRFWDKARYFGDEQRLAAAIDAADVPDEPLRQ